MVLNTVLYLVWIGLPILVFALVLIRGVLAQLAGEEDRSAEAEQLDTRLKDLLAAIMIAAALTIVIDNLLIPSMEFRRLVYRYPLLVDAIRALLFPFCLLVGRSIAIAVAFVRPPQVDARFQHDIKGISPFWAALGFGAALFTFLYQDEDSIKRFDASAATSPSRFREIAPLDVNEDEASGDSQRSALEIQYEGTNYLRYAELIRATADEHGFDEPLLVALVAEESNFNPEFQGAGGGVGLLNVTANMAAQVNVTDRLQVVNNLTAGALVLRSLRDALGPENPRLWVAAYHFGINAVQGDPEIVDRAGEVKDFVDAVMRKAYPDKTD